MKVYIVIEENEYLEINHLGYVKTTDSYTTLHKCFKEREEAEKYYNWLNKYNKDNKTDEIRRTVTIKEMYLE